jgi:UDP-glucose 4-epimerase
MPDDSPWRGRTVLVTGGLGFIGGNLVRQLVGGEARVRVLDALLPLHGGGVRNLRGVESSVEVVIEDTRNRDAVDRAVQGCDVIFHLAAPPGPGTGETDPYSKLDIACLGALHLLEAVRLYAPAARVVLASSNHVYTPGLDLPVQEGAGTDPASLFGIHKLTGEKYFLAHQREHGTDVVIARLTSVFGPGQRIVTAPSRGPAWALGCALRAEPIRLGGAGAVVQDLLFIDDAVAVLLSMGSLRLPGERVFNVGSGTGVPLTEMAELIVQQTGLGEVDDTADVANGLPPISDFVADISRLRGHDLAPPHRDLEKALSETVTWFKGESRAVSA